MPLSHLPALVTSAFAALARCLDPRSAARLPAILAGLLLAKGRRTVTAWLRAAGIAEEFRPAYTTVSACGRRAPLQAALAVLPVAQALVKGERLVVAIDDTPTPRYGPKVEGAGVHHNPTPGPAGEQYVYGHVWVNLAALARHPDRGTTALPLLSELYVRQQDIPKLDPDRRVPFRTKLEMAAGQLGWLRSWADRRFAQVWGVTDGAYAKRPVLKAARQQGIVLVGRLARNAALWSVPVPPPPGRPGRKPVYGKQRVSLAKRAGHKGGWQDVECTQYGRRVTKTVKTFLATWRPAGGVIRVVLVKEEGEWRAYFCTAPEATPEEILEAVADRTAIEQTFKDLKEVWGAGQQQVRNLHASAGCFNLNGWMYTLVEAWAWGQADADLADRSACPWDDPCRRPSHADKRKALLRHALRAEIQEALAGRPTKQEFRDLAERLLEMAA
jgi:DDE superfamily endonuclease